MGRKMLGILGLMAIVFSLPLSAARTNYFKFIVNGSDTATQMTQGTGTMAWECDCGPGDTLLAELYLDLNGNHSIDAGDKLWPMGQLYVMDGDVSWNNGPADSSAVLDGIFYCILPPDFSLAPTSYIMKITNPKDASTAQDWLKVNPTPSPAFTISGTVSIEGVTAPNSLLKTIWVCTSMDHDPAWWSTLTDSTGHYTLNMPDTGIWHISPIDNISPYTMPNQALVHLTGNTAGINFEYKQPEAFVYGDIKDERDSLVLRSFHIYLRTDSSEISEYLATNGHFVLGAPLGSGYRIEMNDEETYPDYLEPNFQSFSLTTGDSIKKNIVLIKTDTIIFGIITENGGTPSRVYEMQASKDSSGMQWGINNYSNSNGLFEIPVSSKYLSYDVRMNTYETPLPDGFGFETQNNWNANPGDTVKVRLVSYKGSASGALTVDNGDPTPEFSEFTAELRDTSSWETKGQTSVDSNGTFKVYGPQGVWNLQVYSPSNRWLIKPSMQRVTIDTVNVPGNNFFLNYAHCIVSGNLHGLVSVPQNNFYINASEDSGYNTMNNVIDSTYSIYLCEGIWQISAPWVMEWDSLYYHPNDTTITITDSDSAKALDFIYLLGVEEKTMPLLTALNSISPNPFNGKITFKYSCASPSKVSIAIYDLTGRLVKNLTNKDHKSGSYVSHWNGQDNFNKPLANGIYFCKFSAGNAKAIRKLILIK
ncbi:MAG: T9SS type A sorting domain-containing protein [bacterium]|nr:T9SS type A sorting domain-containing protein [bacterium]